MGNNKFDYATVSPVAKLTGGHTFFYPITNEEGDLEHIIKLERSMKNVIMTSQEY